LTVIISQEIAYEEVGGVGIESWCKHSKMQMENLEINEKGQFLCGL
jgi:hypothetical protein